MAAPFFGMVEEVRVMLVGNDEEFVPQMIDLLEAHNYKVITVDTTSSAMSMLSKGKQQIDAIITKVHSSDMLSFHLLSQAVALDIISFAVCDEDDEFVAKKALEEGASLCLNKSFNKEIVKYLWQFVFKGKRKEKRKVGEGSGKQNTGEKKNVDNTEVENKLKRKKSIKIMEKINEDNNQNNGVDKVVKQKGYIEWTNELHAKFVEAVQKLGDGKCYPKEILEMMNAPGLTRMQVASHLQKCRRNNWRSPNERKSTRHPSGPGSSSDSRKPRSSCQKFGSMPPLQTNVPNLQKGPDFNKIFGQGEDSIQQLYHPQLQVQPNYFIINNSFSSAQAHHKQHASLYGMLGSQRPQGPIIENTNYRPNLMVNSGNYHGLSGYYLDLNVAQGATHSVGGLMPVMEARNGTTRDHTLNIKIEPDQDYSDDQEAEVPNHAGGRSINDKYYNSSLQ